MRKRASVLATLVIPLLWAQVCQAQIWSPLRGGVELKDRPQINGKLLARVPAKARLKESEKRGYWVKVEYQGMLGWVPMSAVHLVTNEETPKIDVIHSRSKRLGGVFKHTFKICNTGTVPFSGIVTLQGYSSGEMVFDQTVSFREQPLPVGEERKTVVDVESDFADLEYKVAK